MKKDSQPPRPIAEEERLRNAREHRRRWDESDAKLFGPENVVRWPDYLYDDDELATMRVNR